MADARQNFDNRIDRIWSAYFGVDPVLFHRSGTYITPLESLQGKRRVHLYHIGDHALIQCDETLLEQLKHIIAQKGNDHTLTMDDLRHQLGEQLTDHSTGWMYYLYPPDFTPQTATDVTIRQILTSDEHALDLLKSACSDEDVDEGWVHVTDELGFGAFMGDVMVACATMYDWRGFADPGVLVHPDYRQRGLGTAVVSSICQWVIDHDRVMTYRCDVRNNGSSGVARRLGFKLYFDMDAFEVINNA